MHRRRGDLATEAEARYVEYGFRRGILSNFDPPFDVPRYREYADLEATSRLWHERPDRWRQETDTGDRTAYRVADGRGPWWSYGADGHALYSPTNGGGFSPDGELSCLLDPYEIRYGLGDCEMRVLGAAERLGRGTVEVEASAVSWDHAPVGPFWDGADNYLISVDAEVGTILRFASRFRGEECEVYEVTGVAFDEVFPEGTFVLDLPGVEFPRLDSSG